ncbi:metallophosphoesterase [bacterium]|nr:metallophosphoesterase [bacterium]
MGAVAAYAKLNSVAATDQATLRMALLSDTHTPADPANGYRGHSPIDNLKRIVPQVVQRRPEGVIVNGDAARLTGELEDYAVFKELVQPMREVAPIYVGLGNHDHRENFFSVIEKDSPHSQDIAKKHVLVIEHPAVRLVVLDSLLYVNKTAGLLGQAQRAWISEFLEGSDRRPIVFFVHHTIGDRDGDLLDSGRFLEMLETHKNVKAIFYGHSHRYEFKNHSGIHLINLPAVGYNFNDREPVGWVDSVFSSTGVDLTLHVVAGNAAQDGVTTVIKWA